MLRLNIGCGDVTPEGWINIDNSWHARLVKVPFLKSWLLRLKLLPERYAKVHWQTDVLCLDLTRPLPFAKHSVHDVYASHVFEHLSLHELRALLKEIHRVLVPGGILRVLVPDLDAVIDAYLHKRNSGADMAAANHSFIRALGVLPEENDDSPRWLRWSRGWRKDKNLHGWVYNYPSIVELLTQHGFSDIQRLGYLQGRMQGLQKIERQERCLGAICLEASHE